jgi:two-component system sensor histidine kinase KdpD
MSEHVAKVLQMTRLENRAIELQRDWASLGRLRPGAAPLGERMAGHRLMVEIPDELPLVRIDATLVEQALGNLLENAARHTPPGTVVRLRAAAARRELIVSVEDFGGGLPDGDVERVFAKFHHGNTAGAGSGMGWPVDLPRDREAPPGRPGPSACREGTAFRFTLPLEDSPVIPAEALAD